MSESYFSEGISAESEDYESQEDSFFSGEQPSEEKASADAEVRAVKRLAHKETKNVRAWRCGVLIMVRKHDFR